MWFGKTYNLYIKIYSNFIENLEFFYFGILRNPKTTCETTDWSNMLKLYKMIQSNYISKLRKFKVLSYHRKHLKNECVMSVTLPAFGSFTAYDKQKFI